MPTVTVQITREGTTGLTFVVIQEVATEDWGVGGLPAKEYWRQAEARSAGGSGG